MQRQEPENRVLHELAFIYIALAHGTDEQLSDEEIQVISDRLQSWEADTAQTATSALKEAMDDYVTDWSDARLERAAAVVRDAFPLARRNDLLNDLMEIALADGRFLFKESSYIERVSKLLAVHSMEEGDNGNGGWSLLGGEYRGGSWSSLHDLALIFVTLAHRSDNDLATEEVEAIAKKLQEWVPDAPEDEVLLMVRDVLATYAQGHDARLFAESVASVREHVPEHQRPALIADLKYIAEADGRVLDQERELIQQLEDAWAAPTRP